MPAIYSNPAAQKTLRRALNQLNQEIDNLLFNVKVRKALVSDTVTKLLSQTQYDQNSRTTIQPDVPATPVMNQGAIQVSKEPH